MIIYFTGTGNSLAAARRLAERTGDRAVPLRAVRDAELAAERCIGIVFPVYCFDVPPPVREFVAQARFAKDAYICVLATNCADLDAVALSQLYRDRADCENVFDELKNHWGWGGFVTRDLARTRLVARLTALLYNLWTVFTRLVSPEAHREAETSRPMLLGVLCRVTRSGRKTTMHLVSNHAAGERIAAALSSIHRFMRRLNATAGQLDGINRWAIILAAAFRHFLHGRTPHPPLDGNQWLLPLASAAY